MAWSATEPKEKKAGEEDEEGAYPPESGEEENK
jgi:adenylate kinase